MVPTQKQSRKISNTHILEESHYNYVIMVWVLEEKVGDYYRKSEECAQISYHGYLHDEKMWCGYNLSAQAM